MILDSLADVSLSLSGKADSHCVVRKERDQCTDIICIIQLFKASKQVRQCNGQRSMQSRSCLDPRLSPGKKSALLLSHA